MFDSARLLWDAVGRGVGGGAAAGRGSRRLAHRGRGPEAEEPVVTCSMVPGLLNTLVAYGRRTTRTTASTEEIGRFARLDQAQQARHRSLATACPARRAADRGAHATTCARSWTPSTANAPDGLAPPTACPSLSCSPRAYPERVRGLVLDRGLRDRATWAPDWPWGISGPDDGRATVRSSARSGVTGMLASRFGGGDADRAAYARLERIACTPTAALAYFEALWATDVREALSAITAPTAVVHHVEHPLWPIEGARYVADHIDGAKLIELPGRPEHLSMSRAPRGRPASSRSS